MAMTAIDMAVSKDRIRAYCTEKYVEPARHRGDSHVTIRSSDVLEAFGLEPGNRIVCDALWSVDFELANNLFRISNSCIQHHEGSVLVYKVLTVSAE